MTRLLVLSLALGLAALPQARANPADPASAAPPGATALAPASVPAGTRIPLALSERLDSRVASTGQHFELAVTQDVLVDGVVAVPKGSVAQGTVLFARKKGAGRSGALDLRVDHVDAPAGRLRVRAAQSRRSEYIAPQHAVVHAFLGLGALPMQGENIVLEPGAEIEAEVVATMEETK